MDFSIASPISEAAITFAIFSFDTGGVKITFFNFFWEAFSINLVLSFHYNQHKFNILTVAKHIRCIQYDIQIIGWPFSQYITTNDYQDTLAKVSPDPMSGTFPVRAVCNQSWNLSTFFWMEGINPGEFTINRSVWRYRNFSSFWKNNNGFVRTLFDRKIRPKIADFK